MELVDEDLRRWHCKKDKVYFLASRGGWIEEEEEAGPLHRPSLNTSKIETRKLYATGVALNFILPGAGVMYAGKKWE
jgi:hypothetical protein